MNTDELVKDISDRLTAIGESVSETRINTMVQTYLDGLLADEKFVRKMRFGGNGEQRLVGSKFSRYNLDLGRAIFD